MDGLAKFVWDASGPWMLEAEVVSSLRWTDGAWIAFLLAINGFFVAAEFALVKVRLVQIEQLAQAGNWAAKLTLMALERLDAYLSASQLGITVASLALGTVIEQKVEPALLYMLSRIGLSEAATSATILRVAVPLFALSFVTFLHMALGEQAPKSLAIRYAKTVALVTGPPMVLFYHVFWPIIRLLNAASNATLWLLGLRAATSEEVSHTEEELRHIVAESAGGGHLTRAERMMIENVLNLEDKTARRVMVPRPDIIYLSLARSIEENLRIARSAGHTRFPLCEDDLTRIVGMIHVKDLFRTAAAPRVDLRRLSRPVPFLPETIHLDHLLLEFQRKRTHLAMLVDEYGAVVGMITLENVLEQVVGPIEDEFDREIPRVIDLGSGIFDVDAACPLDELSEVCQIQLPETDASTAGGLILERLGRLAQAGDAIDVDGHRFTVTQADPTRIRRVRVESVPQISTIGS